MGITRRYGLTTRLTLERKLGRRSVWTGPPPYDFATRTSVLASMCRSANADTVIIDSLKDGAIGLSDDAVGAAYNRARQIALEDGVPTATNHLSHSRPAQLQGSQFACADPVDVHSQNRFSHTLIAPRLAYSIRRTSTQIRNPL
jgi:hypothetical protein